MLASRQWNHRISGSTVRPPTVAISQWCPYKIHQNTIASLGMSENPMYPMLSRLHRIHIFISYTYVHTIISIKVWSMISQWNPTISQWNAIISGWYPTWKPHQTSPSYPKHQTSPSISVAPHPNPKSAGILQAASSCMLDAIVLPSEAKDKVLTPLRQVWTQARLGLFGSGIPRQMVSQ